LVWLEALAGHADGNVSRDVDRARELPEACLRRDFQAEAALTKMVFDGLHGAPGLLGLLDLAQAIVLAADLDDGGVVRQPVDEPDGTRGVGKDGVPVAEGEIRTRAFRS
jgi:hypothetical protein